MNTKRPLRMRKRLGTITGTVLALAAAFSAPGLTPASFAQTANEDSFYFKRDAGGFQGTETKNLLSYGSAYTSTGTNLLKKQVTNPNLRAQIPDTVTSLLVTPASVNSVQSYAGAVYYTKPIDLTKGFRTKFFVLSTMGSLCFVIRNPDETRPYVPTLDPDFGIYGLTKTMAVMVLPYGMAGALVGPNQNGLVDGRPINGGFGSIPLSPKTSGVLGTVIVQYIPRSHVLEMHYQDMFSGARRRVFQATDIDLEKRGILKGGKAYLGFVGMNPRVRTGANSYSPVTLQSWEFGNSVSMQGVTSTSYSDRMVFKTDKPLSVWAPTQNTTTILEKVYQKSGNGVIDESSSSGGFGAGFSGEWDGNVGIRFKTTARNGSMNIRYPMFLNLQFPPQATQGGGSTFTIKASFEPDALAGFSTTSPDYNFKASTWFGFNFTSDLYIDLAVKKIKTDLPSIHANVSEFEIFDSDTALQLFGNGANAGYASGTMKDGAYLGRNARGGGGSTKGAKRGVNPLAYIQALVYKPNLAASGYVDVFDDARPTRLTATAKSDFAGLRADFTSALLSPFHLDSIVNQDLSFNLGAGNKYAFGWHIADLYGDLLTTVDMNHSFQPSPYLVLQIDDLNATTGAVLQTRYVKMALDPNGKPLDSPAIYVTPNPMRITPKVYLSNPRNNGVTNPQDPTLPNLTSPFNLFNTQTHLNLEGRVEFKPFEIYAEGTGIPDLFFRPAIYTLFDQAGSIASRSSGDFEVPNFQPVVGKPYYYYPYEAAAPVVDAATPNSVVLPPDLTNVTYVQLTTQMAGTRMNVLLDGQILNSEIAVKDDVVHFGIPNNLLQTRAVHQIAIMTNAGTTYQRVSNTVTFEVSAPLPAITTLSPSVITLNENPIANGAPVLKKDANGIEYLDLTVQGKGFCAETLNPDGSVRFPQSVVTWNGLELPTTFVSATTLKAVVNRTLLATAGSSFITVRTNGAGGGESAPATFLAFNPTPTFSSASASLIRASAQTDLVVKGSDFVKGTIILLKLQTASKVQPITLPTTFASAGELSATIAPGALKGGTYTIQVLNPAPGGTLAPQTASLVVDASTPTTTLTVTGTSAGAGIYQGQITLTAKAGDTGGAGIDKTFVEIHREGVTGDDTPVEATGPITLSQPGNYTVRYYSTDKVGNEEKPHTLTITIIAP